MLCRITTSENAKIIRDYMENKTYRQRNDYHAWRAQFYRPPSIADAVLHFSGLILETHGTESLRNRKGEYIDYCNTGDSYAPTLVYHHGRGRYLIASWGDIAERET